MKIITEAEAGQLREAGTVRSEAGARGALAPAAPILPISEYLCQVEQLAEIFPEKKFQPAEGAHWRL